MDPGTLREHPGVTLSWASAQTSWGEAVRGSHLGGDMGEQQKVFRTSSLIWNQRPAGVSADAGEHVRGAARWEKKNKSSLPACLPAF